MKTEKVIGLIIIILGIYFGTIIPLSVGTLLISFLVSLVIMFIFKWKEFLLVLVFPVIAFMMFSFNFLYDMNLKPFMKGDISMVKGDELMVVLGNQVVDGKPSNTLKERLDKAYEIADKFKGMKIIVTGFKGPLDSHTQASVMKKYLVEKGVDQKRIIEEKYASNTVENLNKSKVIGKSLNKNKFLVVTSDFHLRRAMMIASLEGMDAIGVASTTNKISLTTHVTEFLSTVKVYLNYYTPIINFFKKRNPR